MAATLMLVPQSRSPCRPAVRDLIVAAIVDVRGDHRADHIRLEVDPFLALMIGSIGVGLRDCSCGREPVIGETLETCTVMECLISV